MNVERTKRGTRALAALATLYGAAFVLTSFPLALLALVATFAYTYLLSAFRESLRRAELAPRRDVLEQVLYADQPVNVETTLVGQNPAGVRLVVEDVPPEGWKVVGGAPRAEPAEWRQMPVARYTLRPSGRGVARFRHVRVRAEDAHGLFRATLLLPAPRELAVNASLEMVRRGRAYARKHPFDPRRKGSMGLLFREYEFESVREYQPGDEIRAVDWKASTRFQELMTKTFEREMEGVVYCVVDASRTMRERTPGTTVTKLDHAADLVLQAGEVASMRNFALGLIVFDERGVRVEVPASRGKGQERELARRILTLPDTLAVQRRVDAADFGNNARSAGEVAFLERLRDLRGASRESRAASTTSGAADAARHLGRLHRAGSLFVFWFSDFASDPGAGVAAVASLRKRGHQMLAALLPDDRYLRPPPQPTVRDVENAYRARAAHARARATLARQRVRVVDIDPDTMLTRLVEERA